MFAKSGNFRVHDFVKLVGVSAIWCIEMQPIHFSQNNNNNNDNSNNNNKT